MKSKLLNHFSLLVVLAAFQGELLAQPTQSVQTDVGTTPPSTPEDPAAKTEFLRMQLSEGQPQSLDTAVVSYRGHGSSGAAVDLIGAVHIGEAAYYDRLNELFDSYDVLLYELVAPEGTSIPKGGKRSEGFNPVAMLQNGAKNMLGLEAQLERIDYTKPHFVRADMTPRQIAQKMDERGDNALTLALDTFADVMRQQNLRNRMPDSNRIAALDQEISLTDMLGNPLKMKRLLAQQFADTGSIDQAMGDALNQLLIVDRNAEALKGLQKQLAAGKRKIGIFYGAAHLPDLEKHLVDDFGLKKTKHEWLVAWDLQHAKKPAMSEPVNLFLNILKAIE